ncbi:MAG: tRNA (adenosine(37)-N6)-dimethylallyltransferase MiaA [Candidatus Hydrogenedentota bacterium]
MSSARNLIAVLGPTASGKTRLGVALARRYGGEVLSVDSRQVYRGLDIGSGKDLDEYGGVPYHLIDIADLAEEMSVFDFQRKFFDAFEQVVARGALPIAVGGTGLYLDAVLQKHRMVEAPEDPALRAELAALSMDELAERLRKLKVTTHNITDTRDRDRCIRAIEIATRERDCPPGPAPPISPVILGVRWPRAEIHKRIAGRLRERLDNGLIEEVRDLLDSGVSADRLRQLGLEYRFVTEFIAGEIRSRNDLFQKLRSAIFDFAKRQETWFRRMERNGAYIQWITRGDVTEAFSITDPVFARP